MDSSYHTGNRIVNGLRSVGGRLLDTFTRSLRGTLTIAVSVEHSVALVVMYAAVGYLIASKVG